MPDFIPPVNDPKSVGVKWRDGKGDDPARYLINPGSITLTPGGAKEAPGNLFHPRPYIINGDQLFVFPVGVEAFRRSGEATLGLHTVIGKQNVIGVTVNYEQGRIELSGMFPGFQAQNNMTACLAILTSKQSRGMQLHCPGVLDHVQIVLPESWSFDHSEDDRTHSITYTISFVKIDTGAVQKDPHGKPPRRTPVRGKSKPRGKTHAYYTIKSGVRSLRAVAKVVYGNADRWNRLVPLNQTQINKFVAAHNVPTYKIPTYRWPLGTKFRYR